MGVIIDDGAGRGFSSSVSESNRLNVSAKTAERPYYVSRDDKLAFIATSIDATSVAGEYPFYLKNTSTTRNLFLWEIHMGTVEAVLFKMWEVSGTATGTEIFPVNLNLGAGLTAEASAFGNAAVGGLTAVNLLHLGRTSALGEVEMEFFGALILAPQDAIAIEYDTGTTGVVDVTAEFHYENFSRSN
jgi:hypothetical protein